MAPLMGELSPPTAVTEGAAMESALVFSPLRPCGTPPPEGEARERSGARGAAVDSGRTGASAPTGFEEVFNQRL